MDTLIAKEGHHRPNSFAVYGRNKSSSAEQREYIIQFCSPYGEIKPYVYPPVYGGYSKRQAASRVCLSLNHPLSEMFRRMKNVSPCILEAFHNEYRAEVERLRKDHYQLKLFKNDELVDEQQRTFVQAIEYWLLEHSPFPLYNVRWKRKIVAENVA